MAELAERDDLEATLLDENASEDEKQKAKLKLGGLSRICVETITVQGHPFGVCTIREIDGHDRETMSTIDSVLAETSSFARTIMDRLKGLRIAQFNPPTSDLDILTEREREILGLICRGKSDLQMSEELKLSHNTVRNHVASLYRKLGVNRRSAAIIWARERGLTDDDMGIRRRRRRSASNANR